MKKVFRLAQVAHAYMCAEGLIHVAISWYAGQILVVRDQRQYGRATRGYGFSLLAELLLMDVSHPQHVGNSKFAIES